ncbi:HINT domain-containing protein [Gemmata sp. JC673]|uniref:HINT domain-containing protein n=1 Tax=Gemmata algarum TaxID=2975278 RepID=A0ABU5F923_9BACT|nr:hypothetical protein [Gemmata algarum]MDY3562331.1 HINT domain-containing protein [Gemmata algarum]
MASRTEHDPCGPVEWKAVEDTFRRTGRVLHLHFGGGERIRTTPEHPFWVDGKGWTAAGSLAAGDRIATLSGEWVPVAGGDTSLSTQQSQALAAALAVATAP